MASELRWILLAIGLPLLAAIWWWTSRRSRQGAESPELREVTPTERVEELRDPVIREESGEWGVPPFEPLNIRTADFEEVHAFDHPPMTAHAEPLAEAESFAEPEAYIVAPSSSPSQSPSPSPSPLPPQQQQRPAPAAERSPAASLAPAPEPAPAPTEAAATGNRPRMANTAETQRIFSLRVCAADGLHWSGVTLLSALNDHGMAHGRYQVFHRKHSDGRTLFCAASLVEPGTFNLAQMPTEEYRGLTLFAVLPGPCDAVQTVDALIDTADGLAQTLNGIIQDSKGQPLTPAAVDALRDDAERFQIMLAMN